MENKANQQIPPKKSLFWEARNRILAWYMGLMSGFLLLSIPLVNYLILAEVNVRVRSDLNEEIEAFVTFKQQQFPDLDQLQAEQLEQLYKDFLKSKVPEDDTFLLTFINYEFYSSNPRAKPEIFNEDTTLVKTWLQLEEPTQGEWITDDPEFGRVLYIVRPIVVRGEVQGTFVAAHVTAGEIAEAREVFTLSIGVILICLFFATFAAWIASSKVLNPLRRLSKTVASVDEADLKRKMSITAVNGSGEVAQLSRSFNQMMNRLHNIFVSQRELLNDVGHELRTPITIVRGHLELMGSDPQEQEETMAIVFDELDRMNRLVNNLIVLAKAERLDFLQEETIDIADFTTEIYNKMIMLAQRDWQLDNKGLGKFVGDRQRLTQAMLNLVENAIQHTTTGDRIILGSQTSSNSVSFWIEDSGQGFASGEGKFIFQRFARSYHSRNLYEGQGLGLSIVQAIVQAHQGQVEAQGELGKGATFTIILPLEQ